MMDYPQKEGKHGPIYQIADGIFVVPNEWGTWQVVLKRGSERKKKSFGKGEQDRQRAIKAAELLAAKLDLTLEKQKGDRTFGMVAEQWYELNAGRWQPGTRERYQCIVRDHLRPLHKLSLEEVSKAQV
jgi:hypothetical protein